MSAELEVLWQRIEAFERKVLERYRPAMRCGRGCDSCCHCRLSATGVEATAIRAHLRGLEHDVRERLRRRAGADQSERCPALEDDGACGIYPARPIICRTHGLPIRFREPGRLPIVEACELNFRDGGPEVVDGDCVLDQVTLSTALAAVDAADAERTGREGGERVAISAILASAVDGD